MQAIALPQLRSMRTMAAVIIAAAVLVAILVVASVHLAGGPAVGAKTQLDPAAATASSPAPAQSAVNCHPGRPC